ncbi:MAG: hypothetical protein DRP35_04130 [Candidatus Zixiibacteriota bacterium]|nr:MAG: hypothetical protein DRP35_04130 [candidate division Zixibacteria bacterium]
MILELKGRNLKAKNLYYNAKIYTQADSLTVNSMAVYKNKITAIGNNLEYDPDFKSYAKIDLKGKTITPGFVDAHTHFYYFALSFRRVSLDGLDSLEKCLNKIKVFAKTLKKNEWVLGEGYSPDRFKKFIEPDKYMLDKVTGGRPAFIFSKDQHSAWANSKAIQIAGVNDKTKDPVGGKIEKLPDGTPSGIFREKSAFGIIYFKIPLPSKAIENKCYNQALEYAYEKGVVGVHSMDDSPGVFDFFLEKAEKGKLGLRLNYYFPAGAIDILKEAKIYFGMGDEFLRVAGIKIFTDGALGSKTGLCFNKYIGSKDNFGIEISSVKEMLKIAKKAVKLNLPCAVHAIGDKAVSNVLEVFESLPGLHFGARQRIEHLQMIRRKDISRLKKVEAVASMQPSHCLSDIQMVRKYLGNRGNNCYIFKTLIDQTVPLAFGSDVPIEPLDPIAGIDAAVRRAKMKSKDVFYPKQRITAEQALYNFTVGPAYAVGQEYCRGYLLPGYPADFVVLSQDICKIAPSKIINTKVLATFLDGKIKYIDKSLSL